MLVLGGSPGLVDMGGNSHSKGSWFDSQHWIPDGAFLIFICCEIVKTMFELIEKNKKRLEMEMGNCKNL